MQKFSRKKVNLPHDLEYQFSLAPLELITNQQNVPSNKSGISQFLTCSISSSIEGEKYVPNVFITFELNGNDKKTTFANLLQELVNILLS